MKRRRAVLLLFFLLFAMLLIPHIAAAVGSSPKKVLLLTSYHQGDRWNDSVVQGVQETLGSLESVSLSIENLDMRRYNDPAHARLTREYIRAKYQDRPQNMILVSDDPALNFLLTAREELFPTVPVVFCGINNFNPKRIQGQSDITGVNEDISLEATLELALELFPQTSQIMAVVSDIEDTGRNNLEHYRAVAARMNGRVTFGELLNMTDKDAPDILSRLPQGSVVLRLINLLKADGGYLSIEDSIRLLAAHAPVPVFTIWSFDLGDGALGGYVASGLDQGRTAGNLAIRILEGQEADQIPVLMDSPNVPMFDFKIMERFGLKESALPKESIVLNRQVSMWTHYQVWFLGFVLIGGLQAFLILALMSRGRRLQRANAALRESELRFKALHNASFGGITIHDKGRILDCNQGLSTITGYSYEELIGMDGLLLIAEQSRKLVMENILAEYEKPYEAYGLRKNGEEYPLRLEARNIPYKGSDVRVVEFRDITEQKKSEEALRESEERFRMLASESPVSIMAFDREGRVTFVSDWHLVKFTKGRLAPEFFLSRKVWELPSLVSAGVADQTRGILTGESLHAEDVYIPSNSVGEEAYQSMRGVPLRQDGAVVGGVLIREDITERKRVEEALRHEETRLRKLVEIIQCDTTDTKSLLDIALGKCLELTESRFGYIYHYDEDSQSFTLNTWSRDVMQACSIAKKDTCYELSNTGIWGEAVRQRRAIIVNDFQADNPLKKGYPEGHAPLTSFLTVPIVINNRIVAVVGVANKQTEYTDKEVLQLTLLMDATWRVLERRRAQEILRANEERLNLALDAADDGLWDWDISSGEAYFSPRYYTMLRYQPGEFPSSFDTWKSLLHPDEGERTIQEISKKLNTSAPFEVEFRMRTKSGEWAWILGRGKLVAKDSEGRAKRIVGTHVNITERKRAEENLIRSRIALEESRANMVMALDMANMGSWELNLDTMVFTFNEQFYALYSTTQEREGGPFMTSDAYASQFVHPDEGALVAAEIRRTLEGEYDDQPASIEHRIVRRDGAIRDIVVRFLVVKDHDGRRIKTIGVNQDITERKQGEEALLLAKDAAEAANRAKSEFLANMSHEIRTPFSGVLGMLQIIKGCGVSGEVETYADMAIRAGRRLTNLLGDILDLSRIEAGRMPIINRPFALSNLFTALAETFSPMYYSKSLSLEINASPDLPSNVVGDEMRIRQILFNLVGNAMKFTDKGEVRVEVSKLLPSHSGQARLLFIVSDTGPGIPDEMIGQICAPFVQVSSDFTRSHQGAGLGLSITRGLIEAMGGTLSFESTEGQGTAAYLGLPFSLPEPLAIPVLQEFVHGSKSIDSLRLLLVEDEEINRLSTRLLLEKLGHKVDTANNGQEALEALRVNRYDCVLMDVQMDVMNGLEATRLIRSGTSGVLDAQVPIVAVTAFAMAGDRERFLEAGMNGYVAKPVQVAELQKALGRVRH